MRVFLAIERLTDYALCKDDDMTDAVLGVFLSQEKALLAAEKAAALLGCPKTERRAGKYIVCPQGHILYEVIPYEPK